VESVLRGAAVYLGLLLVFRVTGKRTMAEITTFDFVILLIIGEAVSSALQGNEHSLTNAFLIVVTLFSLDIGMSLWKQQSKRVAKLIDGVPLVIVENGKLLQDRMAKSRVDESDILGAARELQGLERIDQIKYAVLERSGGITIIPMESKAG
jgi:uncharacterized membrane protein YcaP (DUF421 family)